jgi:tetratricopeptide (TPR) repeat protein
MREIEGKAGILSSLHHLGMLLLSLGKRREARSLLQESLTRGRTAGDRWSIAGSLHHLGLLALAEGEYGTARLRLEESRRLSHEMGARPGLAAALLALGELNRREGDPAAARALCAESLRLRRDLGERRGIAECLEGLARVAGDATHAMRLFAAAQSLRDAIGASLPPSARAEYDRAVATARAVLGEAAAEAAWARGSAITWEQGADETLEEVTERL